MPKVLSIAGIIVAALMLLLFGMDLAMRVPFGRPNPILETIFLISTLTIGALGWLTLREQK